MLPQLSAAVRVFLCTRPTDLRKGFDGLSGLVQEGFSQDPLSGHLFLFLNRRRDRMKILYFDCDGLVIWYKRLEVGSFQNPKPTPGAAQLVGARDLVHLVPFLTKYDMQADLQPSPPDADLKARAIPGSAATDEAKMHMLDVIQRFARAWTYDAMPWLEAQETGLLWAPLRKPHENALDPHWLKRGSFADVVHPELGESFR